MAEYFEEDYVEDDEEYEEDDFDEEEDYIIARRFNNYDFFRVNTSDIEGIQWIDCKFLNGEYTQLGYYILKGNIDYDLAVELGMASGIHSNRNNGANIFIYKCDNQNETKESYKALCERAGRKPVKRKKKKIE